MEASELRLGNLVYDDFNDAHRVEGIKSTSPNEYDNCNGGSVVLSKIDSETGFFTCDVVSPIPLAEEWLLKFGFRKDNYRYILNEDFYYENGHFWIGLPDGQFWRYVRVSDDRTKYVHQLQNLYFALTGEELTIKETV